MQRPDQILTRLERAGFEAYYVGGCVRDTLLGRTIHDWDITTSARPEELLNLFPHCVPTGIRHGTVTVLEGDTAAEVTTFRKDGAYQDGRHPDKVLFVSELEEDLARRDFTINAMAMDLRGKITDCFGGREDLQKKMIRCVGEPERRFQEDALRMLRAVRFSAQLGFAIEQETMQAIEKCAGLCRKLSRERVSAETEKTLLSARPERLEEMIRLGLLAACGAEGETKLAALRDVPAEKETRWAMLQRLVPTLDLQQFRLSSKLTESSRRAAAAYQPHFTRQELKTRIAEDGEELARICAKMSGQEGLFLQILQSGECARLRDLAVTGKDFPALRGKEVGAMLQSLLAHVLLYPEDNDRQTLLRLAEELSDPDGHKHIGDV